MKLYLRQFPIGPKRHPLIKWVNGTPHLSAAAANFHREALSKVDTDEDHSKTVYQWLQRARVRGHEEAWRVYQELGPAGTFAYMISPNVLNVSAAQFAAQALKEDVDVWKMDPTLEDNDYLGVLARLKGYTDSISHKALRKYESKQLLKYGGDATVRTFDGYVAQVKANYVPERSEFRRTQVPELQAYEMALRIHRAMFHPPRGYDADQEFVSRGDFLADVRNDTFGGPPYSRNMGDFVSKDESDPTTYADLYNKMALLWLFLPPSYKRKLSDHYFYSALERIQTGGLKEYTGKEATLSDLKRNKNKQRFVQAESAIFPRALKVAHDILRDVWRDLSPYLGADKVSEEKVSQAMKAITTFARAMGFNLQGADYTNFDATQAVEVANDDHFNIMRLWVPDWFTYWVLDPYISSAFRMPIFVPGVGLIITSGVKSGMLFTNQTDCFNADLCDIYEIIRHFQTKYGLLTSAKGEDYAQLYRAILKSTEA